MAFLDAAGTSAFVDGLCRRGESVRFIELPGVPHHIAGQASAPAAVAWIADRFAGAPAVNDCVGRR